MLLRIVRACIAVLVLVAVLAPAGCATAAGRRTDFRSNDVTVLLAPYVTWGDINATDTPTLWRLAADGAIGDVNARTRAASVQAPASPLEGPLTLSAGLWAVPDPSAEAAYDLTETVGAGTAEGAYLGVFGQQPTDGWPAGTEPAIVYLGLPATANFDSSRGLETSLGALGQSVSDAGGVTVALGNADLGLGSEAEKLRLAPLAAMDERGRVAAGTVSPTLLVKDPRAPFGVRTDVAALSEALGVSRSGPYGGAKPRLSVIDAGDTVRAAAFSSMTTPEVAERHRRDALRTLDEVAASALASIPEGGVLVVASQPFDGGPGHPEGLGPLIVYEKGAARPGMLTSDSTHRPGLVTQLDVTATLFAAMGLQRPVSVLGDAAYAFQDDRSVEQRVAYLESMNATARAIDSRRLIVLNSFVTIAVLSMLLAAVVISRWRRWRPRSVVIARTAVKALAMLATVAPLAAWLMFAIWRFPNSPGGALALYVGVLLATWLLALLSMRWLPWRVPMAAAMLVTVAVLLVDQMVGYPLSFVNYFGYSPLLGARFYGMGNEASALLFGALFAGLALLFDQWPDARWTLLGRRWLLPVLGAVCVVVAAAPMLGANVGVAVWGMFGVLLAWWLFNGHRVTWRLGLIVVGAIVGLVAVLAFLDMTGATQTHLGRAIGSAQQGGLIELWKIVVRKAETNARVFLRTNYSYILVAVLAYLGYMRWRPVGEFASTLRENRYFAQAITVMLATGVLAFFTEDSGIVIPALISLYLGTGLVWIMLERLEPSQAEGGSPERIAVPSAGEVEDA